MHTERLQAHLQYQQARKQATEHLALVGPPEAGGCEYQLRVMKVLLLDRVQTHLRPGRPPLQDA